MDPDYRPTLEAIQLANVGADPRVKGPVRRSPGMPFIARVGAEGGPVDDPLGRLFQDQVRQLFIDNGQVVYDRGLNHAGYNFEGQIGGIVDRFEA